MSKLLKAAQELANNESKLRDLGLDTAALNANKMKITQQMEALPIVFENVVDKPIRYFVLADSEWWPVHAGEVTENGWLNYRIDYQDGSSESGPARPFTWAHCTVDNTPNYHWLEPEEVTVD